MRIQKYVLLLKNKTTLNVKIMKLNLAPLIDIKSFIQMIFILFGLSNIPRVRYILFELS